MGDVIYGRPLKNYFIQKIILKCYHLLFFQLGNKDAHEAYAEGGEEGLKTYIYSKMWDPEYRPLVYLPPGKGE